MKKTISILSILAATSMLAACGGGGSTGTPMSSTPSTQGPLGPQSLDPEDLIAFVQGGQVQMIRGAPANNPTSGPAITRTSRNGMLDGQQIFVALDQLPGSDLGLLQYRIPGQAGVFQVIGDVVTNVVIPSGSYNGFLDLTYRIDGGAWQVAFGEANFTLDMASGAIAIGGIASNTNNNISIFGDAQVMDGGFTDPNLTIRLRDGDGAFIRDESGIMEGVLAQGSETAAIFGTLRAENPGFQAEGGFSAIRWQGQ